MSVREKKIIFWLAIIIFGFCLLFFWAKSVPQRLKGFESEKLKEDLNFPKIEMPSIEIDKEELQNLKKTIEEYAKEATTTQTTTTE